MGGGFVSNVLSGNQLMPENIGTLDVESSENENKKHKNTSRKEQRS